MIQFGTAGKPRSAKNLEKGMVVLREMGLDALELQFGRGIMLKGDTLIKISQAASDNNIRLSAHAPYYINLNSEKPETIEKSKNWILDTLETAEQAEANIIVVHAGRRNGEVGGTPLVREGIEAVVEEYENRGYSIQLGIETMGRESTWGDLEEIKDLSREVKPVVPVIDFAHIHARYGGFYKTTSDFEKTLNSYEELGLDYLHAHFTSIEFTDKGEKRHLPVSERDPDFKLLAKLLKKKNYDIRIICESPLIEKDTRLLKDWFEEI